MIVTARLSDFTMGGGEMGLKVIPCFFRFWTPPPPPEIVRNNFGAERNIVGNHLKNPGEYSLFPAYMYSIPSVT